MELASEGNKNTKLKNTQIGRALQFYVVIDGNAKMYRCTVCEKVINGNSAANLTKHFKAGHKEIYSKEIAIETGEHIEIQRAKMVHSCVELVTINSEPFSLLSKSGFKSAIENKLNQFKLGGCPLNLSEHVHEIKDKVRTTAKELKEQIKSETQHQIISVMIDSATRNGRSIYGVSIQYKHNGVLKVVAIGMRELKESHTAVYLSEVLLQILNEFGINLNQIISITTDNGSNMLAMVNEVERILLDMRNNTTQCENQNQLLSNQTALAFDFSRNEENIDADIDQLLKTNITTDDDALDIIFNDIDMYEELFENLVADVRNQAGNHAFFVISIKCGAHTVQLVVKDALKMLSIEDQNVIDLCRLVAKFLRLQSSKNEMREKGLTSILPGLDVQTRWSSSYLMVRIT